jgi:secondary thiamine-phosphate synthase enzyme
MGHDVMNMRQAQQLISIETRRRGLTLFTSRVAEWLSSIEAKEGLVTLFLRHTSASLLVQENADPSVCDDLERFFARLVPDGDPLFRHDAEGPDDMPAHVRAALTQVHLAIPVTQGKLQLGTWQGLYLYEHRLAPHRRDLLLHYLGT